MSKKKNKEFAKDWLKEAKEKLNSYEDMERIINFHKRINRKSSYSEMISNIESIIEKALKKKLMEQIAFIDYKAILYRHFMELEGIKED